MNLWQISLLILLAGLLFMPTTALASDVYLQCNLNGTEIANCSSYVPNACPNENLTGIVVSISQNLTRLNENNGNISQSYGEMARNYANCTSSLASREYELRSCVPRAENATMCEQQLFSQKALYTIADANITGTMKILKDAQGSQYTYAVIAFIIGILIASRDKVSNLIAARRGERSRR